MFAQHLFHIGGGDEGGLCAVGDDDVDAFALRCVLMRGELNHHENQIAGDAQQEEKFEHSAHRGGEKRLSRRSE